MCLGNQEIPHYCSLDILRSFTSTGHETGPRIIHKSVFKAKCVEKGYRWKRAEAYVPSRDVGDCTAALKGTQENLYYMCIFTSVYCIFGFLSPWAPLPDCTGPGQFCAWEYWEANFANKSKTSEDMLFVLRAP